MGRAPCCEKLGLKKGPWTPEEDKKLLAYIHQHGLGSWRSLPPKAGLERCGKSCRLRWTNYLRPDIKRGKFTLQDEQSIIQLHALLGNRWSAIATHLPKRTDNEIKNYWNTHLKKKLTKMGIDPITHKPINNHQTPPLSATATDLSAGQQNTGVATSLSHMAQWETARLEAEARLARQSKLRSHSSSSHSERDDGIKVWCNRWSSKSTEGSAEITLPAIGNVRGDQESPTTSTVTFLGNTPPSTAAGVVGKSENLQEAENQEGVGNCLSFSPSLHEMSFFSIEGTQNVARNDDFSEVLLKNSDDDNDPRDGQPSDGGAESENGGLNHNNDYWDTIIGEFLPFNDSPTLEI